MVFNKFSLNITLRVILIVITSYLFVNECHKQEYLITIINLGILLILQTLLIIRFIHKKNQQISEYIDLIKNRDSSSRIKDNETDRSFSKIHKQINETNRVIQDLQIEKESQSNFYNHLVNDINIGLFSFDESEKIQFINPEAKRILGITNAFKIEDFNTISPEFSSVIKTIQPGQYEIVVIKKTPSIQKLSINCSLINLRTIKIKLISFHDIDKHLYANEIESWNKLIRILNHEIMNSITPITSLSKTIKKYYVDNDQLKAPESIESKIISRTVEGLDIIEERGSGLIRFVDNYRKLTSLPEPKITKFSVESLFNQILNLYQEDFSTKSIQVDINIVPQELILRADKDQIVQVMINLVRNSIESLNGVENAKITLSACINEKNSICISVEDNGKGISKEIIDDIFIPFYTTKETGSGIGLSLSKQIMKLHNGTIYASSTDIFTKITLSFNF